MPRRTPTLSPALRARLSAIASACEDAALAPRGAVLNKRRTDRNTEARRLYFAVATDVAYVPHADAAAYAGLDRTTVYHHLRTHRDLLSVDPAYRARFAEASRPFLPQTP
jgi:hypothetical protein